MGLRCHSFDGLISLFAGVMLFKEALSLAWGFTSWWSCAWHAEDGWRWGRCDGIPNESMRGSLCADPYFEWSGIDWLIRRLLIHLIFSRVRGFVLTLAWLINHSGVFFTWRIVIVHMNCHTTVIHVVAFQPPKLKCVSSSSGPRGGGRGWWMYSFNSFGSYALCNILS